MCTNTYKRTFLYTINGCNDSLKVFNDIYLNVKVVGWKIKNIVQQCDFFSFSHFFVYKMAHNSQHSNIIYKKATLTKQ